MSIAASDGKRESHSLDIAIELAEQDVPVFWATISGPKDSPERDGWSSIPASNSMSEIDAWNPRLALCARTGLIYDVIDYDPRNDPDGAGIDGLMEVFRRHNPVIYLKVSTPSGGTHWWIAALGERARKTRLAGVDYLGYGRLVFLPPTRRRGKNENGDCYGSRLPYRVTYDNLDAELERCDGLREIIARPSGDRESDDLNDIVGDMLDAQPGNRNDAMFAGITRLASAGIGRETIIRFAAPALREKGWKPRHGSLERDIAEIIARAENSVTDEEVAILEAIRHIEPRIVGESDEDSFWDSRNDLAIIRQWAQAQMVSPWALLGEIMAEVIARVPPTFVLPNLIAGHGTLNMLMAITGDSSAGKGGASSVAEDALEIDEMEINFMKPDRIPIGSGEGLVKNYAHRSNGELVQHAYTSIPTAYEIDTLTAIVGRGSETLTSQLRQMYSGEKLGFGYGDASKRIFVDKYTYRGVLIAGVQPERSGVIVHNHASGFAQRWLFLDATDPWAPDDPPERPSPLQWTLPKKLYKLDHDAGEPLLTMKICESAGYEIRRARREANRGEGDKLKGHALYTQEKFAAGLAILGMRMEITEKDWELAGYAMQRSDKLRDRCLAALMKQRYAEARAEGRIDGVRQSSTEEQMARTAEGKTIKTILKHIPDSGRIGHGALANRVPHLRSELKSIMAQLTKAKLVIVEKGEYRGRPATWYSKPVKGSK
jgi:hypothetical protein